MKALSIKQPWANLIIEGKKTIEVRTWNTKFSGEFLIHSGLEIDENATKIFKNVSYDPRGFLIGIGRLTKVKRYLTVRDFASDASKHLNPLESYEKGINGFVIENVRKIFPISFSGKLNFFETNLELSDLKLT